jgi:hypothetical protein
MFSLEKVWFMVLVFNATSNNISVISWWSVLLVEETGVPRENHRSVAITDKLYHICCTQPTWIKIALKSNVEEPQEYISLPDPYSHFNLK